METLNKKQFQLPLELKARLDDIVARYETKRAALLPVLNVLQTEYGYISVSMGKVAAEYLELPFIKVEEVLSFYTLYLKAPAGKYRFQVCRTLSCYLCGAEKIAAHLKARLGIRDGQTSKDGQFSLTEVECLGACEIAPMMRLNDQYIGNLTLEKIDELLKTLKDDR